MAEQRKLSEAGRRMVAASLRENREAVAETVSVESLMGSESVAPGCEIGDGFLIYHEVRVTEPWHVSLVRLGERKRASVARTVNRECEQCGRAIRRAAPAQRFHKSGTACHRARARARQQKARAARA